MMPILIICVIGGSIGLSAGLFGIGGALIATPLLKMLAGLEPMLALATPLPAALPSALSGTYAYYRERLIRFELIPPILFGAVPANVVGTLLTKHAGGNSMMLYTGAFMLLVGSTFFIRGWLLREAEEQEHVQTYSLIATGIAAGFLSGFLAIGGGLVMVPAFVRLNRMKFKQATATSMFCVAVLSIPATVGHAFLGHIDWSTAGLLALCSTPMAFLGARLAIVLRNQTLERIYGTCMIVFACYFLWSQSGTP
ncbi:MAG: sulfite exporter TauE/SafE family protein [Bacteroidota bacterium]|nr:sulfite exporter TauE/SafE family protein [Candidatus Kapabacteria bacterium]MDW8221082.1 sulfite exporter TauE/SafE family protein [Bacteroidota bacterium]